MVNVLFVRKSGRMVKRGTVADLPFGVDTSCPYVAPFIAVTIDEKTIPSGVVGSLTVTLKLDKLMKQYPSTTEKYKDEEGVEQERVVHGYFHEEGASKLPYPVITMEDVTWEVVDE